MTTLSDIRDIECRLHSHVLEWDDRPLIDELFYILDGLQYLHSDLDRCDIPCTGPDSIELTLSQRVAFLIKGRQPAQATQEAPLDSYGKMLEEEPKQFRLF